jgi:hypothetical protein
MRDSKRLDWLLDNLTCHNVEIGLLSWRVYTREEIDRAMKECEPQVSEEKPRAE